MLSIATASSLLLPDQFRQRAVFADEVLRAAGEVGELCGGGVNSEPLIERGEDVSEMNWPGLHLFAPARGRAEDLAAWIVRTLQASCSTSSSFSPAEKNFLKFAERMNDEGEPVIDQNHFKQMIARAILFRTTEKLFTALDLTGYRAQSVAYAMSWLTEHSGWRIDLDGIWETQRLSPALCYALKVACEAAHKHITAQEGNPGEVSKRETCWNEFNRKELPVGAAWSRELVDAPFLPLNSDDAALATEWESVRHQFAGDPRALAELEALTGKTWIASRRREPICRYTDRTWEKLLAMPGLGTKRIRGLVEMVSAAGRG